MKKLYARWGDRVHFLDVIVRQAHPGPGAREYRSLAEKCADARRYQLDENVPWPVLVDDFAGTVHQTYGGMADPTYLIDRDGRVAFYNMWTFAPALHEAIEELLEQDGRGVVHGGIDHTLHMAPALTNGWPGLQKGLPQSFLDLELATPGTGTVTWVGYQLRPLLAPLTQRATPLSPAVRMGLGAAAAGLAAFGLVRLLSRDRAT